MRRPSTPLVGLALAAAIASGACSSGPSVEEFCAAADATRDAGPLFPDRTDGEPVPEPDALAALEDLAASSPGTIEDEVDVLLAEARALVADAEARTGGATTSSATTTTSGDPLPRPTRAEVTEAQSAVVAYIDEECDLDVDP